MYFKVKMKPPTDVINAIRGLPKAQQKKMNARLNGDVKKDIQKVVEKEFSKEPGPVKLPFQFATERSRRAYFATNGFGNGIPYQRKGKVSKQWKTQIQKLNIIIFNASPAGKYVYGPRQVAGHKNTGWGKEVDKASKRTLDAATDIIIAAWVQVVDESIEEI